VSRYAFVLNSAADRARAMKVVAAAPAGTRVEVKQTKRSTAQNSFLWAALSQIALQKKHCGRKYTPDIWKSIFMHACGQEVQFIPSLDQTTLIPWGHRSSDLSKHEMSELLEFIQAWCADNGVKLHDERERAA
jgi:hypothetical protein